MIASKNDFVQQILALLPIYVNIFFGTCHLFWLSNAAYYLTKPTNVPSATLSECALIGTYLEAGRLLFALPSGIIVDKFGRNKIAVIVGCVNSLTWTLLFFAESLNFVYLIRFLAGCIFSLDSCFFTSLIGELSTSKFRGTYCTLVMVMAQSSAIFVSIVSIIFNSYKSLSISVAILSVMFYPTIYFLLESPYILVQKGKVEEAKKNLEKLHPNLSAAQIEEKLDGLKKLLESERKLKEKRSLFYIFFRSPLRKILLLVCCIRGLLHLSGCYVILAYSTVILPPTSIVPNSWYPFIANIFILCSQAYTTAKIEKYPRRALFMTSCLLVLVSWISMGTIYYFSLQNHSILKWVVIVGIFATFCLNGSLLSPLGLLSTTEFFPVTIKGAANSVVLLFRSAFSIAAFQGFSWISTNIEIYAVFYFYALAIVVLVIMVYFGLPESQGKSLVDLQFEIGMMDEEHCRRDESEIQKYGTIIKN